MNFITNFDLFLNEAVDFFQKGKFWSVNGKKVKVVGSIPQNPQVLRFQEVDGEGKPIGKQFVGRKGDVKGWNQTKPETATEGKFKAGEEAAYKVDNSAYSVRVKKILPNGKIEIEYEKADMMPHIAKQIPNIVDSSELMTEKEAQEFLENRPRTEGNTEVNTRYKELITAWKENQKKMGKNTSPGEGTRTRLMKQAESEANFDETTDVDKDLANLKRRPSYEAIDRLTSLIKAKKVRDLKNIVRYLDFTKSKMNTGDSIRMNPN